jgi:hypothetical protein
MHEAVGLVVDSLSAVPTLLCALLGFPFASSSSRVARSYGVWCSSNTLPPTAQGRRTGPPSIEVVPSSPVGCCPASCHSRSACCHQRWPRAGAKQRAGNAEGSGRGRRANLLPAFFFVTCNGSMKPNNASSMVLEPLSRPLSRCMKSSLKSSMAVTSTVVTPIWSIYIQIRITKMHLVCRRYHDNPGLRIHDFEYIDMLRRPYLSRQGASLLLAKG